MLVSQLQVQQYCAWQEFTYYQSCFSYEDPAAFISSYFVPQQSKGKIFILTEIGAKLAFSIWHQT